MKKIIASFLMITLIRGLFSTAYANMIGTYSSEEINSISLILSARKKITYNVVVTKQNYTVSVSSCKLYRQNGSKGEFVCNMPNGIPGSTNGDMLTACDISEYITSAGTYYVRATIKAGNSSIPARSNTCTFD